MLEIEKRTACLRRLNITELSPMQEATFAACERQKDIVLISPAGSGKTVAFLWPLASKASPDKEALQGIVLQPSRELAEQNEKLFRQMKTGICSLCVCGGHPMQEETGRIFSCQPQVLFATPGRLRAHIERGNITFSGLTVWILDEFDKCLEQGFEQDIRFLTERIPETTHKWLISATPTDRISTFMPLERTAWLDYSNSGPDSDKRIDERLILYTTKDERDLKLRSLLNPSVQKPAIIFSSTRDTCSQLYTHLQAAGFPVELYHGGMLQSQREKALFKFRSGCSSILVATDLAARGLDIPEVKIVIHYDLPEDQTVYIHRCGRASRWLQSGTSYLLAERNKPLPDYAANARIIVPERCSTPLRETDSLQWAAIYIGRGKKEKLSKTDIVGLFCRKGQLTAQEIGLIDIADHYAYAAVARDKVKILLERVKEEKIKGMKTIIALVR